MCLSYATQAIEYISMLFLQVLIEVLLHIAQNHLSPMEYAGCRRTITDILVPLRYTNIEGITKSVYLTVCIKLCYELKVG